MARRDKYARANGLSKLFEEILARHDGDKVAAKKDMDDKLGPSWQLEIVIDDEVGPEFIDKELLDKGRSADGYERDEMFKQARNFAETFVRPGDDLEFDPKEGPAPRGCLGNILRKLADAIDR